MRPQWSHQEIDEVQLELGYVASQLLLVPIATEADRQASHLFLVSLRPELLENVGGGQTRHFDGAARVADVGRVQQHAQEQLNVLGLQQIRVEVIRSVEL